MTSSGYITRNMQNIPFLKIRLNFLKNSFFPSAIIEWNNLDQEAKAVSIFLETISRNLSGHLLIAFNSHNPKGIKLITILCLGLKSLLEPKFKHSFQDLLTQICNCRFDIESSRI